MIHFSKKFVVTFAALTAYSAFSFADYSDHIDLLPPGFFANYDLQSNGTILKLNDKTNPKEVFERAKDGSLDWSIKSLPCVQNKSYQCVGVYRQESSKIQGNAMNPFADLDTKAGFYLLKLSSENSEKNSVIKCNSKFTKKMVRDKGSLANCVEYSKSTCQEWSAYVIENAAEFRKVVSKVEECTDVMKSVDKINVKLRNIFQSEIKKSEKDISEAYDATTHPDRSVGLPTKTQVSSAEKVSPHISTYKDMFDRTDDCRHLSGFFEKNYKGTGPVRRISSVPQSNGAGSTSAPSNSAR